MNWILVVGGLNMDVLGSPAAGGRSHDSLQGSIVMRPGGVGRNIAARLAGMGAQVELLTVLGNDSFSQVLEQACAAEGIGLRHALRSSGSSCLYMAIHDMQGDMLAAINDMAPMRLLTADHLAQHMPSDVYACCVLDANLPVETLQAAAAHSTAPLVADPVSCDKADRLRPILSQLTAFKPNLLEAQYLSGAQSPQDAADWCLQAGIRQVYISMGQEGLYFATHDDCGLLAPPHKLTTPATGAGDAMTAGIALAVAQGLSPRACAQMGLQASADHLMKQ